jgi:hypothetical protein
MRIKSNCRNLIYMTALLGSIGTISCSGTKPIPVVSSDPDRALVEAWLRENLNDPHWESVKWWPAVEQGPIYDDLVAKQREWRKAHPGPLEQIESTDLPDDEDLANFVLTDESSQPRPPFPEKVIRFKFRTKTSGDLTIHDSVFVIQGKVVRKIDLGDMVFSRTLLQLDTNRVEVDYDDRLAGKTKRM